MLPFPLRDITESVLDQICKDGWAETQTLEFKSLPPGSEEEDKGEFRKDVCAMANADGGDLIFGISEKNSKASTLRPIIGLDVDATKRRLRQILESKVEPIIQGIELQACPIAAGGFVLVMRIPRSFDGPHRFGPATSHRFVIRNDSLTSDMNYEQLRSAFDRSATLLDRAARFRVTRMENVARGKTPRKLEENSIAAVVHIIPLCGLAGRANVDIAGLVHDFPSLRVDLDSVWKRLANLEGFVSYPYDDPSGSDRYMQLFRNGAFEFVRNMRPHPLGSDQDKTWVFGEWIEELLVKALTTYNTYAPKMDVHGPAMVSMSLIGCEGTVISIGNNNLTSRPLSENLLDLPEVMVDDIATTLDMDAITRPIMDVLYQCYGQPNCRFYGPDGKRKARN